MAARLAQPFAIALVAVAPLAAGGEHTGEIYGSPLHWPDVLWAAFALASLGQLLFGMAMGVEGPLEMGYQQAVTPDRLIARMSATRRSVNRGMIVIGAPLGGFIATAAGTDTALWAAAAFLLLASLVLLLSKFRRRADRGPATIRRRSTHSLGGGHPLAVRVIGGGTPAPV